MKLLIGLLPFALPCFGLINPVVNALSARTPLDPDIRDVQISGVPSTRPSLSIGPMPSRLRPYPSPPRTQVCTVQSHNDGVTDDSTFILDALNECNFGGHVIFASGIDYIIGTALNLTFLDSIDIGLSNLVPLPQKPLTNTPQTSKATSASQTTQPTGKPTRSPKSSKTSLPSSKLVVTTSTSLAAEQSTGTAKSGMICMLKMI